MKLAVIGDLHIGCNDYSEKRSSDFSHKFNETMNIAIKKRGKCNTIIG